MRPAAETGQDEVLACKFGGPHGAGTRRRYIHGVGYNPPVKGFKSHVYKCGSLPL